MLVGGPYQHQEARPVFPLNGEGQSRQAGGVGREDGHEEGGADLDGEGGVTRWTSIMG